jgi:dTMP kinase
LRSKTKKQGVFFASTVIFSAVLYKISSLLLFYLSVPSRKNTHTHTHTHQPKMDTLTAASAAATTSTSAPISSKSRLAGCFIVFEGMDRAGKSTQLRLLCDALRGTYSDIRVQTTRFPNEDFESGKRCRAYINGKLDISVAEAHTLFAQNRRDAAPLIRSWLEAGDTVLCDRYAYSGVAYSMAKGLDIDDALRADIGLIGPDIAFLLVGDAEKLAARSGYGVDRHDNEKLQNAVARNFVLVFGLLDGLKLSTTHYRLEATDSIDELAKYIFQSTIQWVSPETGARKPVWTDSALGSYVWRLSSTEFPVRKVHVEYLHDGNYVRDPFRFLEWIDDVGRFLSLFEAYDNTKGCHKEWLDAESTEPSVYVKKAKALDILIAHDVTARQLREVLFDEKLFTAMTHVVWLV